MDLSIKLENATLYIRVATLIKSANGYLFEQNKNGYIYTVGGKIQLNESSLEAAKREIKEELDFEVNDLKLKCVLENFYSNNEGSVHEVCFIYEVEEMFAGELPPGFVEVVSTDIYNHDVRPKPIMNLVANGGVDIKHIIVK